MNTTTTSLAFEDIARMAQVSTLTQGMRWKAASAPKPTLRLALVQKELLCLPKSSDWLLRILSGKAWVSFEGKDYSLVCGESLMVPKTKKGAIISAAGREALLFEIS